MTCKHGKGFFSLKLLIIFSIAMITLAGGGFWAYSKFLASSSHPNQSQTHPSISEKENETRGPIFDLDTFIVNLLDDSGRRYLKLSIKLELNAKELGEEIRQKMPEIQDSILILLSSKSYHDVADVAGKLRLRTEIIDRINHTLTTGEVKKIYFTDFVIQ
jgi:flagellar FliL protein